MASTHLFSVQDKFMKEKPSHQTMAHLQVSLKPNMGQNHEQTPSVPALAEPKQISESNSNGMDQQGTSIISSSTTTSPKSNQDDGDDQRVKNGESDREEVALEGVASASATVVDDVEAEDSGRERLKKYRVEVAGQVWIPDIWGQEELLQDWIDCSAFDASLFPTGIMSARTALVEEGRRENSGRLRIENRC